MTEHDVTTAATLPDGEPVLIGPYARDRRQIVVAIGRWDCGPYASNEEANAVAAEPIWP